jgi:branched-subunit amino acid aminotransferase/4-amino-4-deoxychorismate lyase
MGAPNAVVLTAPIRPDDGDGGVLGGLMRAAALRACEGLGLEVRFHAPRLTDAAQWTEAFLTGACALHSREFITAVVAGPG